MKNFKKRAERLARRRVVCIGSVSAGCKPNVKAVLVTAREGLRKFYVASNLSSRRAAQFRDNPAACLYFYGGLIYAGLMLEGSVEILSDAETRRRFWKRNMRAVYPGGVDDPDYCILCFTASTARYYRMLESVDFTIEQ